jgi:hypothetical protein
MLREKNRRKKKEHALLLADWFVELIAVPSYGPQSWG